MDRHEYVIILEEFSRSFDGCSRSQIMESMRVEHEALGQKIKQRFSDVCIKDVDSLFRVIEMTREQASQVVTLFSCAAARGDGELQILD